MYFLSTYVLGQIYTNHTFPQKCIFNIKPLLFNKKEYYAMDLKTGCCNILHNHSAIVTGTLIVFIYLFILSIWGAPGWHS